MAHGRAGLAWFGALEATIPLDPGDLEATVAAFIERETGLRVMRPTTYWGLLDRWANLYY